MRSVPRSFIPLKQFFAANGRDSGMRVTFGEYWRSRESPGAVYEFVWLEATEECCLIRRPQSDESAAYAPDLWSMVLLLIRSLVKDRATEREVPTGGAVARSSQTRSEVEGRLRGWQQVMARPNSMRWLLRRLS